MFIIDKANRIRITRGDNAEIDVRIFNKDGKEERILETDVLTLTVKNSYGTLVLEKNNDMVNSIFLYPEDTANVPVGYYVYQVDFTRGNEVQTIVPSNTFEIREELR